MTDDLMSDDIWYFAVMMIAGLLMMACIVIGVIAWPLVKARAVIRGRTHAIQ